MVDWNRWGEILRRGADMAGGLGTVLQDPKLRAELAEKIRAGTVEPFLRELEESGQITSQQAQHLRERLRL